MQLKSILFSRFKGEAQEWNIEGRDIDGKFNQPLSFGDINLIVGKNASGKSKTIDAIRHIADLISGDVKLSRLQQIGYGTAEYNLIFEEKNQDGVIDKITYDLSFTNGVVKKEVLKINDEERLNREKEEIWFEKTKESLKFQVDLNMLAVFSKRDSVQYPFLEKLYSWGKNINYYRFGSQLGKDAFLRDINLVDLKAEVDLKDRDEVNEVFIRGNKDFPESFKASLLNDMKSISYSLSEISTGKIKNIPVSAYGLNVKETDLEDVTDQATMSQGMFRALSLLIQLNYSLFSKIPSCILIDDIGEGLDFDRTKGLIDLILEKVKNSSVQIIMTTNDRFIMNKIPLEYWSVIQRISNKSLFYNYRNGKEIFDEFENIGLSNFDFLASEFYINFAEENNKENEGEDFPCKK